MVLIPLVERPTTLQAVAVWPEAYVHHYFYTAGNHGFVGGDIVASYMITGESRPFNTGNCHFWICARKEISLQGRSGRGKFVKISSLDLNDDPYREEIFKNQPMVNWYLSKDVRLELATDTNT